jgi:hypothetical protein
MQTGANISQLFLSASGFLHQFFFVDEASFRKELLIVSGQRRKDLALPRFSGALRRVLATSVFNAALIVEGELGLLSMGFSAHISAQRLVRLLKSESVIE